MLCFIAVGTILSIAAVIYLFPVFVIQENSMTPTLQENEVYVTKRVLFKKRRYAPRDICFFHVKEGRVAVKRVHHESGHFLYVLGDNPLVSHDSRAYGYVKKSQVISILVRRSTLLEKLNKKVGEILERNRKKYR